MTFNLTDPIYSDANAAREHLEALHWPNGPVCPHCGGTDRISKLMGKSTRPGVHKCNACAKPFTVTVGTIFEDSKVPLNKWLLAFRLMASSKKGISAHQLHRSIGVTYKTAWFMEHRIREAMREEAPAPMGGGGGDVEIDETFIGRKKGYTARAGSKHKHAVVGLVDRQSGRARMIHAKSLMAHKLGPIVRTNVDRSARLLTDEASHYVRLGREFAGHEAVCHGKDEYVRAGDRAIHTNTIEGFFAIFKRGMRGIYQHCGERHLQRYLTEFEFRYSERKVSDAERTDTAMKGARGKRLTYRRPVGAEAQA